MPPSCPFPKSSTETPAKMSAGILHNPVRCDRLTGWLQRGCGDRISANLLLAFSTDLRVARAQKGFPRLRGGDTNWWSNRPILADFGIILHGTSRFARVLAKSAWFATQGMFLRRTGGSLTETGQPVVHLIQPLRLEGQVCPPNRGLPIFSLDAKAEACQLPPSVWQASAHPLDADRISLPPVRGAANSCAELGSHNEGSPPCGPFAERKCGGTAV